jgi:hemoglobin
MSFHELPDGTSVFDFVGGAPVFRRLVDDFYARVEADETLRAIFPDDLAPGKEWQYLFLTQFFGGPATYLDVRGHPRLRMRHQPYRIDRRARDAWLGHMLAAIDAAGIAEPARTLMRDYFERGSEFLMNVYSDGEGDDGA